MSASISIELFPRPTRIQRKEREDCAMPFNLLGQQNFLRAKQLLEEFDAIHIDERICQAISLQWCIKLGFIACAYCNHHQVVTGELQRMYLCAKCRKEIWVTAGTFFDHVRKFRPYLAAIYLYEHGVILSASDQSKLLCISQSTADKITKKLAILVTESMQYSKVQVSSDQLTTLVSRRSTETPARQTPIAEEEELQKRLALNKPKRNTQQSKSPAMSRAESALFDLLSDEPESFQTLIELSKLTCSELSASITLLELRGLAKYLPGDRFIRTNEPLQKAQAVINSIKKNCKHKKLINRFIRFVKERFQGVSRKYLQLYAAIFHVHEDRKRWGSESILRLCARSRHISTHEIKQFITPPMVKFARKAT